MSGEIGECGKLEKNNYFEERLTKGDRGDRKKKVDSELSLRELKRRSGRNCYMVFAR